MHLPKELTTVTTVSKAVALIMFITLPIIAFLFGMKYQIAVQEINTQYPTISILRPTIPIACTMEAKLCPDGTSVGRVPPKCEFSVCPSFTKTDNFCGGISGKKCSAGFVCKLDGKYPDAGGTCVKTGVVTNNYTCPTQEFVNCMPSPDKIAGVQCSSAFLTWAESNCPGFKGAAY